MAAITRRGQIMPVSISQQLVAADDLTGTAATRRSIDVTGATRVIISQFIGTDGTAGIDAVVVSKDGGLTWAPDATILPIAQNDATGTIVAAGVLNVAGTEAASAIAGLFKGGPYEGPTLLRIARKTAGAGSAAGTTWVTGAPAVHAIVIGGPTGAVTTVTHTAD